MTKKELMDKMAALICNPTKNKLTKPIWKNNRVCLSDGHIAIIFNDIEYCPEWTTDCVITDRVFEFFDKEGVLINTVELPSIDPDPTWLDPFKKTEEQCSECDGDGTVTCDYDHEHECPECDGSGKEATYAVFSIKNKKRHERIELPSIGIFQERYLWMVSQLAEYRQLQYSKVKMENCVALAFSFEDGNGLIMSLTL